MRSRTRCPLLALPACLALLLAAVPGARGAPRVGVAASAGRTFAAAARSVDAGGGLTVTGGGTWQQSVFVEMCEAIGCHQVCLQTSHCNV